MTAERTILGGHPNSQPPVPNPPSPGMTAETRILGEHPFAADARGKLKSRIGTVFPQSRALITLPGIHATQRQAWLDFLKEQRCAHGLTPLTREEERLEWTRAVDLIFEADTILIRPNPENMPLAFRADDFLQEMVSKHKIKFLGVLNKKVREAIKMRGEWWRIAPLPKSPAEMEAMIRTSRAGMSGKEIYYYSRTTGIRYLTCQQFAELEHLDDSGLREHLAEIQEYSRRLNAHGHPEVALFALGGQISPADFAPYDFFGMDSCRLRGTFHALGEKFCRSVAVELRGDDPANVVWRNSLVAALIGQEEEVVSEETLLGLSPEFFMQIEWLPGGRIEEGELIFDSILEEADDAPGKDRKPLYDEKPQKFIFNFVREYGDLEYVNIGRVVGSLSHRPNPGGTPRSLRRGHEAPRQLAGDREHYPHAETGSPRASRRRAPAARCHAPIRGIYRDCPRSATCLPATWNERSAANRRQDDPRALDGSQRRGFHDLVAVFRARLHPRCGDR